MVTDRSSSVDTVDLRLRRGVIVTDYFFPGFRGGGVCHGVLALVTRSSSIGWEVLTTDRDLGAAAPYPLDERWGSAPWGRVTYLTPPQQRPRRLWRLIRDRRPDVVVFTSTFSPRTAGALLARRLSGARVPCTIWTQGELRPAALAQKPRRKRLYLALARRCGLFRGVTWLAADENEVAVASALSTTGPAAHQQYSVVEPPPAPRRRPKRAGRLHLIYASRVVPRKGLLLVLDTLADVTGEVDLEVIGPDEDRAYAQACRRQASRLPSTVRVDFRGALPHAEVTERIAAADAAVLLTDFESFGYAIHEAMALGCVPVISPHTPFSFPADQAGFIVSCDRAALRPVLQELVDMDGDRFARRQRETRDLAVERWRSDQHAELLERRLLDVVERAARDTTSSRKPETRTSE